MGYSKHASSLRRLDSIQSGEAGYDLEKNAAKDRRANAHDEHFGMGLYTASLNLEAQKEARASMPHIWGALIRGFVGPSRAVKDAQFKVRRLGSFNLLFYPRIVSEFESNSNRRSARCSDCFRRREITIRGKNGDSQSMR